MSTETTVAKTVRTNNAAATATKVVAAANNGLGSLTRDAFIARTVSGQLAAVLMTHHYEMDSGWLKILMQGPAGYVGLMGHRRRGQRILSDLGKTLTEAQVARFYSPVGLDLGSESPESIALSILAEIQAVFGMREPRHLRSARGAIHGTAR